MSERIRRYARDSRDAQ